MSLVHPADRDDLASLDLLTDADGRGELRILPPETEVQVQIFHPAFLPAAVLLPRLSFGERHEFIAVLSKAGSITGEILAPMPGAEKARVELVRAFPGGGSERVGVVEMEEKRRFRFDGVPPGPVRLQYSRRSQDLIEVGIAEALALEGQNVDVGTIPVEGGSARLLVADPEGWVEDGRLADVSLRIHFLPYETPQRMLSLTWTLTIDREVEVRGIPRAALQASASVRKQNGEGSDRRFVQTSLQVPDFEATDGRVVLPIERMPAMGAVELLLQPPSSLEGTQLRAWAFATRGGEVARTIFRPMPADQPLELDRLRVGEHRVVVMADRFVSDHLVVDVREDETSTVTVKRWRPARSLVGETVDESGEPVPKAELTLFLSGETRLRKVFSVYSDTAGRFEILALPPGEGYFLGDDRRKEHLSSLEAILKDPAGRVVVERR